jgi:hypothetical protein
MAHLLRRSFPLLPFLLAAACAQTPPPAPAPPPPAALPGMERLLGRAPEAALALLGQPGLDRQEGVSRQLQFAGSCILDIYYYPKPGVGMVATYATSRLPDGRDLAAGQCLGLLLRARPQ